MTPKEKEAKAKAKELIEFFIDFVNPYIGSGMLSDSIDKDFRLEQAKKCATRTAEESHTSFSEMKGMGKISKLKFWTNVKSFIEEYED